MKVRRYVRERVGLALASSLLLLGAGCGFGEPYEISEGQLLCGAPDGVDSSGSSGSLGA